jgi:hypothetical protein
MAMSLPIFAYVLEKGMMYLDGELKLVLAAMGRA